jgi:hypothetical protein
MVGLALAATLVVAVGGCATAPKYRFVGSDDRDLVIRIPRSWTEINTNEALKASGVDPTTHSGWTAFYDGSTQPSVQHMKTPQVSAPVMVAQSLDVSASDRASVTDAQLRDLLLPGTPQVRSTAQASDNFALIKDEKVSNRTEHGAHVVFYYRVAGSGREYFDQVAVTDPKRLRVHMVGVHCSQECFTTHAAEIDAAVSSLTLKSR